MRFFPRGLSWTVAAMVLPVVIMLAQHAHAAAKKKPAPTPAPGVVHQDLNAGEEYWACGLGTRRDRSGDHCQCPAMVAEVRDEQIEKCYAVADPAKYDECMLKAHTISECDIVKNEDLKHPVHSCKRSCSAKAVCRCHDGPACVAPPFVHDADSRDQQQQ